MKTSLLPTLSFLLLLFSTKLLLARSTSPEPVYDTNFDEVKPNHYYYVLSALDGAPDGPRLIPVKNSSCQFNVVLQSFPYRGEIEFSPYDNSNVVRESTDLNMIFRNLDYVCRYEKPPIWKVSDYDPSTGTWLIHASGEFEKGNPGAKTLLNWFQLERVERAGSNPPAYKFVHCPSVCDSCAKLCNSLGVYDEGGIQRLVLVQDNASAHPFVLAPGTPKSTYKE